MTWQLPIPKKDKLNFQFFYIIDYLAGLLKDGRIHYLLSLHNSGWPDDKYFCEQNKKMHHLSDAIRIAKQTVEWKSSLFLVGKGP